MFAGRKVQEAFAWFIQMIDGNIDLFGEALQEKLESTGGAELTDEEFVDGYVDGMHRLVGRLHAAASARLQDDPAGYKRYQDAIRNPRKCGFRFQNSEMTAGKVYLYYIWGTSKKRAPKSDCIRLEKHLMQKIGQQCVQYGIVN